MHATKQSTDQRGAMETIQKQPFGHWLLIAVAIGLGAYASGGSCRPLSATARRAAATTPRSAGWPPPPAAVAYAALCPWRSRSCWASSSQSSSNPHKQDRRRARVARRPVPGRRGGPVLRRRRALPGVQGPLEASSSMRTRPSRSAKRRSADHRDRRRRTPRADGRVRPDRLFVLKAAIDYDPQRPSAWTAPCPARPPELRTVPAGRSRSD